jgi:hypothetical protein
LYVDIAIRISTQVEFNGIFRKLYFVIVDFHCFEEIIKLSCRFELILLNYNLPLELAITNVVVLCLSRMSDVRYQR